MKHFVGADASYFSENNISKLSEGIVAVIATCREPHNTYLETVLNQVTGCVETNDIDIPDQSLSVIDQMRRRLKIPQYNVQCHLQKVKASPRASIWYHQKRIRVPAIFIKRFIKHRRRMVVGMPSL
jgi:hypothetical protein